MGGAAAVVVASNTQNAEASEKQLSGVKIYISLPRKREQNKKRSKTQKVAKQTKETWKQVEGKVAGRFGESGWGTGREGK